MPWLMDRVEEQLERSLSGRTMLDAIIHDVVEKRIAAFKALEEAEMNAKLQAATDSAQGEEGEKPAEEQAEGGQEATDAATAEVRSYCIHTTLFAGTQILFLYCCPDWPSCPAHLAYWLSYLTIWEAIKKHVLGDAWYCV